MVKPIDIFLEALKSINLCDVELGGKLYERPFAYELYHRFKRLLEERILG